MCTNAVDTNRRKQIKSDATAKPFFQPCNPLFFSEWTFMLCSMSMEHIHADQDFWEETTLKFDWFCKVAVLPKLDLLQIPNIQSIRNHFCHRLLCWLPWPRPQPSLVTNAWVCLQIFECFADKTVFSHKITAKLIRNRQFDTSLCCMQWLFKTPGS